MSRESILTEPYLQSVEMIATPPRVVTLAAGSWTLIASAEPQRLTLTLIPNDWSRDVLVSPINYGAGISPAKVVPSVPIQLHAAVYPLLIGGRWWGYSPAGQDVTIIETLRRMGQ